MDDSWPRLFKVECSMCEDCLDGKGGECHTPGCIFWLHRMDVLPLHRDLMSKCEVEEKSNS
jgi:hypothetical protein